ncbi:hypothetical protein [Martelella sp. AMO21009]
MSQDAFGRLFDPPVDKSTVHRWERGRLSVRRAIDVERITGIPRWRLLPDIFQPSEPAQ